MARTASTLDLYKSGGQKAKQTFDVEVKEPEPNMEPESVDERDPIKAIFGKTTKKAAK